MHRCQFHLTCIGFRYPLFSNLKILSPQQYIDCLEHNLVKYILLVHDIRVYLTNNLYVSYALSSLLGSMYLPDLCSKQHTFRQSNPYIWIWKVGNYITH